MKRAIFLRWRLKIFYDIVSARRLRDILTAFSTSYVRPIVEKMTTRHELSVSVSQSGVRRDQKENGVTDCPAGGLRCQGAPGINKWENKEKKEKKIGDQK